LDGQAWRYVVAVAIAFSIVSLFSHPIKSFHSIMGHILLPVLQQSCKRNSDFTQKNKKKDVVACMLTQLLGAP
jgi:hypothetical protein